ncbi:MAG: hypothetical protein LBI87_11035 [Candidatus Accumulibacter sp.]|jgi:hypothetical protein|nr:hypothetical protein [Accumulibacter sp.]
MIEKFFEKLLEFTVMGSVYVIFASLVAGVILIAFVLLAGLITPAELFGFEKRPIDRS